MMNVIEVVLAPIGRMVRQSVPLTFWLTIIRGPEALAVYDRHADAVYSAAMRSSRDPRSPLRSSGNVPRSGTGRALRPLRGARRAVGDDRQTDRRSSPGRRPPRSTASFSTFSRIGRTVIDHRPAHAVWGPRGQQARPGRKSLSNKRASCCRGRSHPGRWAFRDRARLGGGLSQSRSPRHWPWHSQDEDEACPPSARMDRAGAG
jgi:hypothetical protein